MTWSFVEVLAGRETYYLRFWSPLKGKEMAKAMASIASVLVISLATPALAASYTSELGNGGTHTVIFDGWKNGPGWNWSTTGGFDGAGYISTTRTDGSTGGAYMYTIDPNGTDPATSNHNFLGDLPGQWADGSGYFYVDYYVKDIDGSADTGNPARSPGKDCLNILAYVPSEVQWTYAFDSASGGWDHRYVQFKSDWTDAQAQAAGWVRNWGSDSFVDAISDAYWMLIGSNGVAGASSTQNPDIVGLDNITISSGLIPGPAHNPGDVDDSGLVGGGDLTAILTNWGQSGMSWGDGDVEPYPDGDGFIGGGDYTEVLTYWGTTYGPEPIPEPATVLLLGLGMLSGLIRRP